MSSTSPRIGYSPHFDKPPEVELACAPQAQRYAFSVETPAAVSGSCGPWFAPSALSGYGGPSLSINTAPSHAVAGRSLQHDAQIGACSWDNGQLDFPPWNAFKSGGSSMLFAAEHSTFDNFDGFTTPVSATWNLQGLASIPDAHQPLVPIMTGSELDFNLEAGLQHASNRDVYPPLMPTLPWPEAQFGFVPQHASPQVTAAPLAPIAPPQAIHEERHACPKGCNKTIRRAGDYRRHMKKHGPPLFKCPIMNCDKTFYRTDKLRTHIKGHGLKL